MLAIIIAVTAIIILAIITWIFLSRRKKSIVSVAKDGSWWQVDNTSSMGIRSDGKIYEKECDGEVVAIGNDGGPLFCNEEEIELNPDADPDLLYGISGQCPSGWIKDTLQDGSYVCHPDIDCIDHSNCNHGEICSNGKCIPIPDF